MVAAQRTGVLVARVYSYVGDLGDLSGVAHSVQRPRRLFTNGPIQRSSIWRRGLGLAGPAALWQVSFRATEDRLDDFRARPRGFARYRSADVVESRAGAVV